MEMPAAQNDAAAPLYLGCSLLGWAWGVGTVGLHTDRQTAVLPAPLLAPSMVMAPEQPV